MKKINGMTMRRLGTEAVVVAESQELVDFDRIVSLNRSAAYVWEALGSDDFDVDTIARQLMERYEVEEDTARKDAAALADVWLAAGIIEK
ncbi:MAG: PqqD family protein [Muribaculaceae bacterium]|nr:PqqD family protein [Muribaculaceae bacterium]